MSSRELAGEILHDALESIQLAMAEFAPDGAWKEGPGYWNYATSYNVVFLAGLQTALGTDFGLSQIERVQADRAVSDLPDRAAGPHLQLRRWRRSRHFRAADVLAGATVQAAGPGLV